MGFCFCAILLGEPIAMSICSIGEEANIVKTPEEEKSMSEILDSSVSSASSYKDSANNSTAKSTMSHKETLFSVDPLGNSLSLSLPVKDILD